MEVIRRTVTVPASRELRIQLPEEALPDEEAEVIVLIKRAPASAEDKIAAVHEAARDDLFLNDLNEVLEDFQYADKDEYAA